MLTVFGYLASVLIGISLGLIGGGGSILTVPVLVYLFHISPSLATSYSLFVVGSTSLIGAWRNYREHQVNIKTALFFGTTSIITILLTRHFLIPVIPDVLFNWGTVAVSWNLVTMLLFAVLMVAASVSMIRPMAPAGFSSPVAAGAAQWRLMSYGVLIGLVTGILGAGGGFLLIPALILLVRLPVKTAIGTSLLIIALNSLIGFTGDIGHHAIEWALLARITALAIAGVVIGNAIGKKINGAKLKTGFGWFVLLMGVYILVRELL